MAPPKRDRDEPGSFFTPRFLIGIGIGAILAAVLIGFFITRVAQPSAALKSQQAPLKTQQ